MQILNFNNVSLNYFSTNGETKALDHVNFSVDKGEFVVVVKPLYYLWLVDLLNQPAVALN